jgi:hypothetical protein
MNVPGAAVPLSRQIQCVERELRHRAHVYPRLIQKGRINAAKAAYEIESMTAVLATLRAVAAGERLI